MDRTPDSELLIRYQQVTDQDAFAELVQRHCSLVWAAALRVSRDAEAARDVTQTVFCLLVRKAGQLPSGTIVAGWLHRTACLEALRQVRDEARRTERERTAMNEPTADTTTVELERAADTLQPLLDQALSELGDDDRQAVVLRYLSGRSLADIGAELGTSEDAAQKRVCRAVEKLRTWFRQRGIAAGEGVVAAALGLAGAQAAPVGLAASTIGATLAVGGGATATLSGLLFMKTKILLGTMTSLVVATLAWQQVRLGRLSRENAELARRVSAAALVPPAVISAPVPPEDGRQREERAELLRLRSEVARSRQGASGSGGRSVEAIEERARQAEARTQAIREEVAFRLRRTALIEAGKMLGMSARMFAMSHQDRLPASWDELGLAIKDLGLSENDPSLADLSPDTFDLATPSRSLGANESQTIVFREREPRRIPEAIPGEEEWKSGTAFAQPLRKGWERSYVLMDGSVQTPSSPSGDFSEFEKTYSTGASPPP